MKLQKENQLQSVMSAIRYAFVWVLCLGLLVNLLHLATPLYSMQVLDRVISSGNKSTLLMLTIIIGLAICLLSLIQAGRSFAMIMVSNWMDKKLGHEVLASSIQTSLVMNGKVGSQYIQDLNRVKTFITGPQFIMILDIPWSIVFIIVLFMIHPNIGLLALLGSITLILLALFTYKLTHKLQENYNELQIENSRHTEQITRNAEIITVMGLMPVIKNLWDTTNEKLLEASSLYRKRNEIMTQATTFVRTILTMAVIGVGAVLVIEGLITPGAIIAASAITARALMPWQGLIQAFKGYIDFRKSYGRLRKAFEMYKPTEEFMSLPVPSGTISMEGVYFAPPGTRTYTVKNASFNLPAGKAMAMIGHSASGKTTLAKLMCGAWEAQNGAVRIDGANIKDWNRDELGAHIGYVPQDVELFKGTIKENIARLEPQPNAEKVIRAAQLAGVHEMILRLPKGYETEIGYDGASLSGGQRQRIALARAFYGEPKILILDEPNASLDKIGEAALQTAIETAKEQGITTVIITHKGSIINVVDFLMLVQAGTIAEFGPKDAVMAKISMAQQQQQASQGSIKPTQ